MAAAHQVKTLYYLLSQIHFHNMRQQKIKIKLVSKLTHKWPYPLLLMSRVAKGNYSCIVTLCYLVNKIFDHGENEI